MNTNQLIEDLEKEIIKEVETSEQNAALLRLKDIAKVYNGADRVISSAELVEIIKNAPPERKMMSGFQELDDILDGFRERQLVVLSGITKHGKTSMAVELTIRMADEHPLWIPFEEPAIDLIRKFTDRGAEPPQFYTPETMTSNSLDWIEKKIVESKAKYDSKIVFIDHLGFIQDSERAHGDENMSYKIERIVRSLKRLAVKWEVVIVLLAHLTKTKIDTNPSFDDLKGSSAIAQEADTVMLLWRKTERHDGKITITNEANLSVQANRRTGRTGNVQFVFQNGRYLESEWTQADAVEEKW
jgi:replicative DNA helicase